ncbi:hypothetical protein KC345_g11583, partial [Hortaea werneckii]
FLDFFISPEDYYLPWILGSFFRLIRIISVIFSIFAAPAYVAVLTYHFEVLPDSILGPLIMSRLHVPLPPVMEVIFLEITIELLREAGARLPTKIGQTLGIVGGIVIGEASVRAALTSNILIIIVAFSALASFTTPIFKMANTIRLLRFPFMSCILLLAVPAVILSGCNDSRIVDHINMVTVLGFDRNKSELVGTALYQDYDHEGKIEILEGKGKAVKLMLDSINMKSSQPIDLGKLCLLVFSKEFAEEGIEHIIQTFCRDPLLSSNLVIAIADGSAAVMFKDLKGKGSEWLPYYLLEQNVKSGNAPFSNMGIFLYDFYGPPEADSESAGISPAQNA